MTLDRLVTALASGLIGFAVTRALVRLRLQAPPAALMRRNVNDRLVPALLGGPLAYGALAALAFLVVMAASGWGAARVGPVGASVALLVAIMEVAGSWDDRRGEEAFRGFAGHIEAARSGRLSGGLVKVLAGALAGLTAGALVSEGRAIVETALLVALGANLVNLLDRAPGRAAKTSLLLAAPLAAFGHPLWTLAAAGLIGGLLGSVLVDLREEAMLGDAGANPLGAVIGLGLALSLPEPGRLLALAVLIALNAASERWSFSHVIEATSWLRALDRWGRRQPGR